MKTDKSIYNKSKRIRETYAAKNLPPAFAKLYSHHTRVKNNQPGLTRWREEEASERIEDAVRLINTAFILRDNEEPTWKDCIKRAAEIFEWLLNVNTIEGEIPMDLLAAALYQISGYPARASSLIKESNSNKNESKIIKAFLKADFPELIELITGYYSQLYKTDKIKELYMNITPNMDSYKNNNNLNDESKYKNPVNDNIVFGIISCLGVICSEMCWGNEERISKALQKFENLCDVLLYSREPYSWLLSKLCLEVTKEYLSNSMRTHLLKVIETVNIKGIIALDRYLRCCFNTKKSIAWSSQIKGIDELVNKESFTLCTPTGSGKTTVAEIAILQSLFHKAETLDPITDLDLSPAPLVLYIVPSRALATEVEMKLSRILNVSAVGSITVTGLYGGADWGPTDAWVSIDTPTVLICTYEKAEALVRFLSPFFLKRIVLTIIDEAHSVQHNGNKTELIYGDNRPLRLEVLCTKILNFLDNDKCRIIALSAVAAGIENNLAGWISKGTSTEPKKDDYRSTRQLVGSLYCLPKNAFEIYYDLLDGSKLEFDESNYLEKPYIPSPFPPYPGNIKMEGPEKRLRPYLFWAAMQFAKKNKNEKYGTVLISITQQIGAYAEDFLNLLDITWAEQSPPEFFTVPTEPEKSKLWERCLASCEDYYGSDSREYSLLRKGIVVHYGQMPGLTAKLLIEVVQQGIVHIVLATSTLSDGINLPFETILIPSLRRYSDGENRFLSVSEFKNLIGRAGRPGTATEGQSLVLLEPNGTEYISRTAKTEYQRLINELYESEHSEIVKESNSPLASLLEYLKDMWDIIADYSSEASFIDWLEKTAPIESLRELTSDLNNELDTDRISAVRALDNLDNILLANIVETEILEDKELTLAELEDYLVKIWKLTYAYYAEKEESQLNEIYIRRGLALKKNIYPEQKMRRRLYRTNLAPCDGNEFLNLFSYIKDNLKTGKDYVTWSNDEKIAYVIKILNIVGEFSKFSGIKKVSGKKKNLSADEILHWWLDPQNAKKNPNKTEVADWHKYINSNIIYKFNWALGNIISIAMDEAYENEIMLLTSLKEWPKTDLPWIVFWLKEILTWGTLDPVATILLAQGIEFTRQDAEASATQYYETLPNNIDNDEVFNASRIRNWVKVTFKKDIKYDIKKPPLQIKADLIRDFSNTKNSEWHVVPVEHEKSLYWYDIAGYSLAKSEIPDGWDHNFIKGYCFTLDSQTRKVNSSLYL